MANLDESRQEREYCRPESTTPDGQPAIPGVRTRQGIFSGRILTVLLVAIALLVVAFALSYMSAV